MFDDFQYAMYSEVLDIEEPNGLNEPTEEIIATLPLPSSPPEGVITTLRLPLE